MSTQLSTNLDAILTQKTTYLIPTNIRAGVTVLGVQGNLEPDKPDQSKTVTPTTSQQVVQADTGYELAQVTVNAVTSAIDANIVAGNIKSGVTILGVTGTLPSDISYGTTLPANPNPGDKFVKVNNDWTELDGIYNYDSNEIIKTNLNMEFTRSWVTIPNTNLSIESTDGTNNVVKNDYDAAITITNFNITNGQNSPTTPVTVQPDQYINLGDRVDYSALGVLNSISFKVSSDLSWHKIEFTNSVSGTEYDTAVDTTEDILGTSDSE